MGLGREGATFDPCERQITRKHPFHRTRESEPLVREPSNALE